MDRHDTMSLDAPSLDAIYRDSRERMLALAESLSGEEAGRAVPACPGWTVKDVYAHVSGIVDDALHDRMAGAPGDEWTARQVQSRAADPLEAVCGEWTRQAPDFEAVLARGGPPQPVLDLWTHEQDVRGALGRPGGRDAPGATFCLDQVLGRKQREWSGSGRTTLLVVTERRRFQLGEGPPATTLEVDDYELVRAVFGRRSRAQFLEFAWVGDGAPPFDQLHLFTLADTDIVE